MNDNEIVDTNNAPFRVGKANQWLETDAATEPEMLFDEFWHEGEMAVLMAAPEAGKSVLAMQIAESIARSRPMAGMIMTTGPRRVLYVDLVMTQAQFARRYTVDDDSGKVERYQFSDGLFRAELASGGVSMATLPTHIEQLIAETSADVVIIDDLERLQRTNHGSTEQIAFMRALDELKRRLKLSILVLSRREKRFTAAPVTRFADSVFTICFSNISPVTRYIKHVYTRIGDRTFEDNFVPTFRLRKIGSNFLAFDYVNLFSETENLQPKISLERRTRDTDLIRLRSAGYSIRAIAAMADVPRSTVHRILRNSKEAQNKPAVDPTANEGSANSDVTADNHADLQAAVPDVSQETMEITDGPVPKPEPVREPEPEPIVCQAYEFPESGPMAGLRQRCLESGKKIFVELEDASGEPLIWYYFTRHGDKTRAERTRQGVETKFVTEINHQAQYRGRVGNGRIEIRG